MRPAYTFLSEIACAISFALNVLAQYPLTRSTREDSAGNVQCARQFQDNWPAE